MSNKKYIAAKRYVKRGWIIHPLSSPKSKKERAGKKPIIKGWQYRTTNASDNKLKKWFLNTKKNIGLQCGQNSGVTVIDFDSYAFRDELFDGIDINTLQSERTEGRGHYYFKYAQGLKSIKRKLMGFEILNDGNQVVVPPSMHKDGQRYKWTNKVALQKFPNELINNISKLVEDENHLNSVISKCRLWLKNIWKNHDAIDVHEENTMLAIASELKSNGANETDIQMFCKVMLPKYDRKYTLDKWKHIKPIHWKYTTLKEKLPAHIQPFIKSEHPRQHNPEAIDPQIANRAKLYEQNCYITEDKDGNIQFHDRRNHKIVAKLRYDLIAKKYYDDNYRNEGATREVNENNSGYFTYYLKQLKEIGIPYGKWHPSVSGKCETRTYKRMIFEPVFHYWGTELYIACRTKNNDGKWSVCSEYVPLYTPLEHGIKVQKIRTMYEAGVPPKTLMEVFGYKTTRTVQKLVADLRQYCKYKSKGK